MFHVDWLSLTAKIDTVALQENCAYTVASLLGGEWLECRGRNGYRSGLRHSSGAVVCWDGLDGMGVHLVLPSDALAHFGDGVEGVLFSYDWRCSRIDVAMDTPEVTVDWFLENPDSITVRAQKRTLVHSLDTGAKTLYIGSLRGGRKVIRIYDKARESGLDGVLTRIEVQLRDEYAAVALEYLRRGGSLASVALRAVDFRVPGDGRKSAWPRCGWWSAAVDGCETGFRFPRRSILDGGVERISRWIERYVAVPLVKCHVALGEGWLRSVLYRGAMRVDIGYYNYCPT
jgi:hypothetical protein